MGLIKTKNFSVKIENQIELMCGLFFMLMGFILPIIVRESDFSILRFLRMGLLENDRISLLRSAINLVVLNALRATPNYLGAFMIAESLDIKFREKKLWAAKVLLVVIQLEFTYWAVDMLMHVHYDFGIPAILLAGLIILFARAGYEYVSVVKKAIFITVSMTSFWFLDIMPVAAALPVGRGELSMDIKMAASVLNAEELLNTITISGFALFACIAILFFVMLKDENSLREIAILKEQNEAMKMEAAMAEMKQRTYSEMQHLVHDLKSPLTVIETLVGVVKMKAQADGEKDEVKMLERAENAADNMSKMISEILYEEKINEHHIGTIVKRIMSQISVEDYSGYVCYDIDEDIKRDKIAVNSVLFPRAVINLIQNSNKAIPASRRPEITLRVSREEDKAVFRVIDNGRGIAKDKLETIWNKGYSGTSSSGIGLAFVKNVIENCGGTIEVERTGSDGTVMTIRIDEKE